jgi:hypothetical protein
MVLFAGAMLAFAALAETNTSLVEERYRAKYGRYTSAEEASRGLAKETAGTQYVGQACCRNMKPEAGTESATLSGPGTEAWYRMKYGRNAPRAEARELRAKDALAKHVHKCEELNSCPLVATVALTPRETVPSTVSEARARLQAKYGRSDLGGEERRAPVTSNEQSALRTASATVSCEHECCKHSD